MSLIVVLGADLVVLVHQYGVAKLQRHLYGTSELHMEQIVAHFPRAMTSLSKVYSGQWSFRSNNAYEDSPSHGDVAW